MDLRAYTLTTMYSVGIQSGIQAAHALVELGRMYDSDKGSPGANYRDWADNHRTVVFKTYPGGSDQMEALFADLQVACAAVGLPVMKFHEGALRGSLTSIALVVPRVVWEYKDQRPTAMLPTDPPQYSRQGTLSEREQAFLTISTALSSCSLAK